MSVGKRGEAMRRTQKRQTLGDVITELNHLYDYERSSTYISSHFLDALQKITGYAVEAVPFEWLEANGFRNVIEEWLATDEETYL